MTEKDKQKRFKLPTSLRHLQQNKKHQAQRFIQLLDKPQQNEQTTIVQKDRKKHNSLFKLNPSSSALVSELPIEAIRQRSKSSRLESLQDEVEHYKQQRDGIKDKKKIIKKYNIDLHQLLPNEFVNKQPQKQQMVNQEQEEKSDIVKPSTIYTIKNKNTNGAFNPTIFQTPILPCFASQFALNKNDEIGKRINEGQGVWKIGKIKIKGNKSYLRVGNIQFEGHLVPAQGRAGCLSETKLYELPDWNNMWIMQPTQDLFE